MENEIVQLLTFNKPRKAKISANELLELVEKTHLDHYTYAAQRHIRTLTKKLMEHANRPIMAFMPVTRTFEFQSRDHKWVPRHWMHIDAIRVGKQVRDFFKKTGLKTEFIKVYRYEGDDQGANTPPYYEYDGNQLRSLFSKDGFAKKYRKHMKPLGYKIKIYLKKN